MVLKRNTQVGKNNFKLIYLVFLFYFCLVLNSNAKSNLEGTFTDIKILDKISSKNTLLKLKNGELIKFKDLSIKSLKCKNSEFDDNPEITAYIQVRDLTNKKMMKFLFLMAGCFHQVHQLHLLIILFMMFGL